MTAFSLVADDGSAVSCSDGEVVEHLLSLQEVGAESGPESVQSKLPVNRTFQRHLPEFCQFTSNFTSGMKKDSKLPLQQIR